jgi:hypothetical protein
MINETLQDIWFPRLVAAGAALGVLMAGTACGQGGAGEAPLTVSVPAGADLFKDQGLSDKCGTVRSALHNVGVVGRYGIDAITEVEIPTPAGNRNCNGFSWVDQFDITKQG